MSTFKEIYEREKQTYTGCESALETYVYNIIAAKQIKELHELYKDHQILSTGNRGLMILCYDYEQLPFWINISFNHDLSRYTYYETFDAGSEDWYSERDFSTFEELINSLK